MNSMNSHEKIYEEVVKNEFPKLIQLLESCLDFKRWGFKLNYAGTLPQFPPCIVYQSEKCKIRFRWEHDRPYEEPLIDINYGRLHAPLAQNYMMWNGEECYCWHSIENVLNFLDGLSPADSNNREFIVPRIINNFFESNKDKGWKQQEFAARKHAYIWDHYGQRLFDLFDLRHPNLWNKYAVFLKEYYGYKDEQNKLKGVVIFSTNPPLYKVC